MYRPHFGLNQAPFGITPNPAFFYAGNTRGAMLDTLRYAVTHGEGIIKYGRPSATAPSALPALAGEARTAQPQPCWPG